jgi:hypothetical protein
LLDPKSETPPPIGQVRLGFKAFRNAAITIAGIEPLHRIWKGQFGLGGLGGQDRTAPAVWNAVLEA